jgi:hypothetical protein
MHVKYFHELCSLGNIPLYLIVYWGYGRVFHWFCGSSKQSLYFSFNFAEYKILFLSTFEFQKLFRHQTDPTFFGTSLFQRNGDHEKKSSKWRATRWKRACTMRAPLLVIWWALSSSPSALFWIPFFLTGLQPLFIASMEITVCYKPGVLGGRS